LVLSAGPVPSDTVSLGGLARGRAWGEPVPGRPPRSAWLPARPIGARGQPGWRPFCCSGCGPVRWRGETRAWD